MLICPVCTTVPRGDKVAVPGHYWVKAPPKCACGSLIATGGPGTFSWFLIVRVRNGVRELVLRGDGRVLTTLDGTQLLKFVSSDEVPALLGVLRSEEMLEMSREYMVADVLGS